MATRLPNGSAEALISRGLDELRSVVELWRSRVLDAIGAAANVDDVPRRVLATVGQLPTEDLARAVWRLRMQTCMLGALDSHWETTTDHEVEPQMASRFWGETADNFPGLSPVTFAAADGGSANPLPGAPRIGGFTQKPFDEALDLFREKQILSKPEWLRLDAEQKRNSFFVANLARRDTIKLVHDELVTSLRDGVKVSEFKNRLKSAFEEKGLSPLSDAHAETIVRTNIATAYGDGRKAQQSSAVVVKTHPYWLIGGVNDGTTRKTHAAAHGISLPNDDPFWARAYPPWGFRCRCRTTARRTGSDAPSSSYPQLAELPDEGFSS